MNATGEVISDISRAAAVPLDLEAVFKAQYERVARVIARVVRDPARAEELAVEVFLRLWKNRKPVDDNTVDQNIEAWLYRAAVRVGLDELRGQARRRRYERLLQWMRGSPTPEEIHAANEEQERVRMTLASLPPRQAELLILRSEGLSYLELAAALRIKAASVGTILTRAQQAFRKEYVNRYGQHR